MDGITLILCTVFMFILMATYEDAYTPHKKRIRWMMAGTMILPILLFTISNLSKESNTEVFYSVSNYHELSFSSDSPADLEITTVTYPKWSCLFTETTFKQLPKGK
jgi:uncharacterized membrane protein